MRFFGSEGGRGSRPRMRVWRQVRVSAIGQRSRGNAGMVVVWAGDHFFAAALSHFWTALLARSLRSLARRAVCTALRAEGEAVLGSSTRFGDVGVRTCQGEGQGWRYRAVARATALRRRCENLAPKSPMSGKGLTLSSVFSRPLTLF